MFEEKIEAAIRAEIQRQAEERPESLRFELRNGRIAMEGELDMTALSMAVAVAVAGGP